MFSIVKMKKIGNFLPCRDSPLQPTQSRATTNNLCHTNDRRNHFVSTKTIRVGNLLIPIPCFLVPHEAEFIELASQVGYINAVKQLAIKYNVNISPPMYNVRRYKYHTKGYDPIPPVIQFSFSFKLAEGATIPHTIPLQHEDKWTVLYNDARYISVCNDDTKTFSTTFTEMKTLATYWVSKLPEFHFPLYYALINSSTIPSNAQTGCLLLQGDRVIFVPIILNALFLFYHPYSENNTINFLFISSQNVLAEKIQSLYDQLNASCGTRKRYQRYILSHPRE